MAKVYEFLATGFEEIEMITTVDLLRRADIEVCLVSITGEREVAGAHGITVVADELYEEVKTFAGDMLLLPGGQPGTTNLGNYKPLLRLLKEWSAKHQKIAAICAAPGILGELGLLKGHQATSYPSVMQKLIGADKSEEEVVVDEHIITSRGVGSAIAFGLRLVSILKGDTCAQELAKSILYKM